MVSLESSKRFDKIQKVSRLFKVLFQMSFIGMPLLDALVWFGYKGHLEIAYTLTWSVLPPSVQPMGELTLLTYVVTFITILIPTTILMWACFNLIKVFKNYEKGLVFVTENSRYIRNAGYALLLNQLTAPFQEALLSLAATFQNPVGERFISMSFGTPQLGKMVVAGLIILISWIMEEAQILKDEERYIV